MSGERAENLPFLLVVISLEEWQVSERYWALRPNVSITSLPFHLSITEAPICPQSRH